MKKFFKILCLMLILVFMSGCDEDSSVILFNKYAFSKETIHSIGNTNVFKPNERIYYLVTLPKPVEKQMLMIHIYKIGGGEQERLGYELVWGKRVKLRDENEHYYTDYIVMSQKGAYQMQVFSRDNPTKLLTSGYFYVKD